MLVLRELTERDVAAAAPRFDEPETRLRLGDRAWPEQALRLAAADEARAAYAVELDGALVAIADAEREDGRAAVALVVAPDQRRRGIGRAALEALRRDLRMPLLAGVEPGNEAAERLVCSAGFERPDQAPDADGYVYFVSRR
jgi:GNAT superfamily N-acetyltransferase